MTSFVNRIRNSCQNEEDMVLCTEFIDSTIRILILRNDSPPLLGEVKSEELWDYAKETFPENEENFQAETANILSGKDASFDFCLEFETFKWTKGMWTRGLIKVSPISEINEFSKLAQHFLLNVGNSKAIADKVQTENRELKESIQVLKERLEDMINIKNSMEKNLYTKFLLILNKKKMKIRELIDKNNLLKRKNTKSVYDLPTDVEMSEEECEHVLDSNVNQILEVDEKPKKPIKRKSEIRLKDENKDLPESTQINQATLKTEEILDTVFPNPTNNSQKSPLLDTYDGSEYNHIIEKVINSKPSTSKQKNEILNDTVFSSPPNGSLEYLDNYEKDEIDRIVENVINTKPSTVKRSAEVSTANIFPSPAKIPHIVESDEEDFELKDEGDSFEKKVNTTTLNYAEEESDVDLFSQSF